MATQKRTAAAKKQAKKKPISEEPLKPVTERLDITLPEILGSVEYTYSNHARLSSNQFDFRIAFGDIGPTGVVTPKVGVIIPPVATKGLYVALGQLIERYEARDGEIADPTKSIEIEVVADPDQKSGQ
jgi:hypothetical protein